MGTHEIAAAARVLHYRHGVGDIGQVDVYADGRIVLRADPFKGRSRFYRGRLVNNGRSVRMYGRQILIAEAVRVAR